MTCDRSTAEKELVTTVREILRVMHEADDFADCAHNEKFSDIDIHNVLQLLRQITPLSDALYKLLLHIQYHQES